MDKQQDKPEEDPAEGSREVIERQLERDKSDKGQRRKQPPGRPEELRSDEEGGGPA
jgi:hypothetical protein